MQKEAEGAAEKLTEAFKQQVFASAFGSIDRSDALKQYYDIFEAPDEAPDYEYEEYEPESETDVQEMLNSARRAGVIK